MLLQSGRFIRLDHKVSLSGTILFKHPKIVMLQRTNWTIFRSVLNKPSKNVMKSTSKVSQIYFFSRTNGSTHSNQPIWSNGEIKVIVWGCFKRTDWMIVSTKYQLRVRPWKKSWNSRKKIWRITILFIKNCKGRKRNILIWSNLVRSR